jgi:hypothetical protein
MYTAAPAALASKYFVLCSQYVRCCAAYTQQAGGSRGMFVACVIAKRVWPAKRENGKMAKPKGKWQNLTSQKQAYKK